MQAWLAGVYPLRLQHGYTIDRAWVSPETNEFLWILSYDGPEAWDAKETAYYASAERAGLDPDPRQYIATAEYRFLTAVVPQPSRADERLCLMR
ncbi:MAG TPA: hypothetical protein VFZ66_25265 [Herpetosiphonaceae bacterium]